MKVSEIEENLNLTRLTGKKAEDKEITGCYIGDLLSLAMARVDEGCVWVTIQTNLNVAAVASLGDAACVIIADGFTADENMKNKAEEEGISVFTTEMTAYGVAKKLSLLGI